MPLLASRALKGLAFGAVAAAVAYAGGLSPYGRTIEATTYDWRLVQTARPADARDDIAIVEINESSVRELEPTFGRWPWPRVVHAGVISFLARARARAVVYDIVLSEPDLLGTYRIGDRTMTGPESDAELVAAVRRAGTVIFAADATYSGLQSEAGQKPCGPLTLPGTTYSPGPGLLSRPDVHVPFEALTQAVTALGHNYLQKDAGGESRRITPFIDCSGVAVPSLGLAAVLAGNQVPAGAVQMDRERLRFGDVSAPLVGGDLLLWMHGPFADARTFAPTYPTYPFFDVLLSEDRVIAGDKPPIDPSVFADKIVFVGTSAAGLFDVHSTAFGGTTPGVYFHAVLADNVLSLRFMRRASPAVDAGVTAGAGLVSGVLAMTLPAWWAVGGVTLLLSGFVVAVTTVTGSGLWVPAFAPTVAVVLALILAFSWQYFVEGREKRQVKRLFGRYVSKDVFEQLMANPALARLGGERREMTVLFSDIRGFTSASEKGTPEAIVAQLNEYFSEMVRVLFQHHGTLDKFVGDMVMGLFGAPVTDPRHADHAVAAAIEMARALDRLNERWRREGRPVLDIGIGINSGEMIAGNIGSDTIMSYTVIGDAVNLGSRIESLNKELSTHILISQATRDLLTTPVDTRLVGEVKVKGRAQAVVVHEVLR